MGPLLLFLFLVFSISSADDDTPSNSDVIVLDDSNFDEMTASGTWLIKFYAPWCGHCKNMAPVWESTATKLKGDVHIAKVDCTVNRGLQERFEIKSYPTIKLWRDAENRTYKGPRTLDAFVDYARALTAPPVKKLTFAELPAILKDLKDPVSFVYLGPKGPEYQVYHDIAYRLQGQFKFYAEDLAVDEVGAKAKEKLGFTKKPDKKLYAQLNLQENQTPTIVELSRGGDQEKFTGPWTLTAVREFVEQHKLHLVTEISTFNFDDVTSTGKLAVFAATKEDDPLTVQYLLNFAQLAKLYKDEFVFANIEYSKFKDYVGRFGFTENDIPTLFVLDHPNDYYWLPKIKHVDTTDQQTFLDEVLSGANPGQNIHPWYSPARYTKWLSKNLTDTHMMILVVVASLGFGAILICACVYGAGDFPEQDASRASAVPNAPRPLAGSTPKAPSAGATNTKKPKSKKQE